MSRAKSVIVVGAGLAGAAVAAGLASRGIAVTVLERLDCTPDTGAETFAPGVHPVLAELGIVKRAAEFARAEVSVLDWGNGQPPWRSRFSEDGAYDFGYQVGYSAFVELLLAKAAAYGALLRRGAEVLGPMVENGRVTGVRLREGTTSTLGATLVVDASGPDRAVSRELSPAEPVGPLYRVSRSPAAVPAPPGEFVLAKLSGERGWRWSIPLVHGTDGGTLTIGDADTSREERWYGYRCAEQAGAGWLGVGDAAGRMDPLFMDPATVTLLAARSAVHAADALEGPHTATVRAAYTACYTEILDCVGKVATFFLDPAREQENLETLVHGFNGLLGGAIGDTLARVRGALAGDHPLFDAQCPEGPLVASLAMPRLAMR